MTPYIHCFVFHVPEFVDKYGGLGGFQMEEVERMNKVLKSAFHRKTHQGKNPKISSYMVGEK